MAPGFELEKHYGVTRPVRRECMFCHNAYPDVPEASDRTWQPHTFPRELPEGIGCQRCHGPGAEHVRLALGDDPVEAELREAIVNPARLPVRRQRDVCYQCHMQPTVTLFGVRRFDRGDYSFRPGEVLSDYIVKMDIEEEDEPKSERFEINHHPYRLEQSRCFVASEGALGCLTCHDPHRVVAPDRRAQHYREACQSCHGQSDCGRAGEEGPHAVDETGNDTSDCVGCHMPKRRTQDVVEVVMTDHLIRRQPGGAELLAPLQQTPAKVVDVSLLDPQRAPPGLWSEAYRTIAALRIVPRSDLIAYLARILRKVGPAMLTPSLELGRAQVKAGRNQEAVATLNELVRRWPEVAEAHDLLAVALARTGLVEQSLAASARAIELQPTRPEMHYNRGRVLVAAGRLDEARQHLERAVELRPNLALAWWHLGRLQARQGEHEDAVRSFTRALAVEPSLDKAYADLAAALETLGRPEEAHRFLAHGLTIVDNPEPLREIMNSTF